MTLNFILGFIMIATRFFSGSFLATGLLWSGQALNYSEVNEETFEKIKANGPNSFEMKLDLSQFIEKYYVNGERVIYLFADESSYPKSVVNLLLAVIYTDPYLIDSTIEYIGYDPYLMARDGIMAINFAANAFWTVLFNGAAIFILNKRELHC